MDQDTKLINLALDCGEIMLLSGAETFRVQDTMKRILSTTGREKIEAIAISTALLVTLPRGEHPPLAMMRGIRNPSVNFQKICQVNHISRGFVSGSLTLDEAAEHVLQITNETPYPICLRASGYGLISGGFSFLSSQSLSDGLISFLIGLFLGRFLLWLGTKKIPYFLPSFLGGAFAALCAAGVHPLLPFTHIDTIVIGGIMPLLPGLTFSKAIRDLLEGNILSGSTRLVEALMTASFLAGGVGMALKLFA